MFIAYSILHSRLPGREDGLVCIVVKNDHVTDIAPPTVNQGLGETKLD
jgi:hypothetical protein